MSRLKIFFAYCCCSVCLYIWLVAWRCWIQTSLSHSFPRYYGLWPGYVCTCMCVYIFIMSFLYFPFSHFSVDNLAWIIERVALYMFHTFWTYSPWNWVYDSSYIIPYRRSCIPKKISCLFVWVQLSATQLYHMHIVLYARGPYCVCFQQCHQCNITLIRFNYRVLLKLI